VLLLLFGLLLQLPQQPRPLLDLAHLDRVVQQLLPLPLLLAHDQHHRVFPHSRLLL
jgi:hypothetical protein